MNQDQPQALPGHVRGLKLFFRVSATFIAVATVIVPGWGQFSVDKPMAWLGNHPAVLLAILGFFVWASWIGGRLWLMTYIRWHERYQQVTSDASQRIAAAARDADSKVAQANSDRSRRLEDAERKADRRVDLAEAEGKRLVAAAERQADVRVFEASAKIETEGAKKARAAFEQLAAANTRIHELEASEQELLTKLAKPNADDQTLFDNILVELPEDHGRLGWLYNGKFAGKQWIQSDMLKISDFTDMYVGQKFRDPEVQDAWNNLWHAMDDFWRTALAERTSEDILLNDGDFFHEIKLARDHDETEPTYDQTVEMLIDMRDEIFIARNRFIEVASDRNFSRKVLMPPSQINRQRDDA